MSISNGQCRSSLSLPHLCCSPLSPPVDTGHAVCWGEARAMVSCIFHVPNESWLRKGECIAEGTISVCTGLLSAGLLLIAVFSCGSSELPTWILSCFLLVLAVIFKADQANCLWMPKNCLPLVWTNPHVCCTVFHAFFLVVFLARSFLSKWCECAASSEFRAFTVCCPDCRDLRETKFRSSGCVWEPQKIEIHLTCK